MFSFSVLSCYNFTMNEKYIPLYRKYRPQKLEEVVGQEHIKKAREKEKELRKH